MTRTPIGPAEAGAPVSRARRVQLRLMLLALGASLWALVILVRLVHLQVLERRFFQKQSARQSERTITLEARRGAIFDRAGRPLAVSVDAESLYAVPQDVTDPARTAVALARALGLDAAGRKDVLVQLQKNRAFVWIKRKLSPGTARVVRELQLDGIGFLSESRRYYPKRELASQLLGYVGLDNQGMSGIEYSFEEALKGRKETVVVTTDARRRPVGHTEKPSTEGLSVALALDESVQHMAERELERAMAETQSLAGMVVVVEPFTGEVLAMANRPTFNPNRFAHATPRRPGRTARSPTPTSRAPSSRSSPPPRGSRSAWWSRTRCWTAAGAPSRSPASPSTTTRSTTSSPSRRRWPSPPTSA